MWSTMDERGLLILVRDGDVASFNQIYTLYAPALYSRCLKLLKDHDMVDDLLQDAFLKVWSLRENIDPDRGFKTFVSRIVENMAMDIFRKIARDKKMQDELWVNMLGNPLYFDDNLITNEKSMLMYEAIAQLTPRKKEIITLCKIQDKSYKEVADELGISVSSVSNQLVGAIKDVKNYLYKNYRDDYFIILITLFLLKD